VRVIMHQPFSTFCRHILTVRNFVRCSKWRSHRSSGKYHFCTWEQFFRSFFSISCWWFSKEKYICVVWYTLDLRLPARLLWSAALC
jgi:hypothetical protein